MNVARAASNLNLEEDDEERVDGADDEDVPDELLTLIVTGVNDRDLPTGHKVVGENIVSDDA